MKILILCNYATGLLSFRSLLIQKLIENGNSVSAVVPTTEDEHELFSEAELRKLGCSLIHADIDRRGINPIKDCKLLIQFFNTVCKEKPDFVITYTIKPNIYGGLVCSLLKIPYAVNITGLGTAFENDGYIKKIVCGLYKNALKKAKVVFFENSENRDIFVNLGLVKEEKTKVLAGAGVDLEKYSFAEYPQDNGETRFLFIGRVMKEKGIDELLSVMRRLEKEGVNCSLDIVGWLEEGYADVLKQYGNEGWLRYHGVQSDVRPFIAASHCFVLPSWHEGMANTNLECAAMGRPVITSNIAGCREAVINGKSGFLCELKDIDSLYSQMKKFCSIPYDERISMGQQGRKHMEEVFDKKKVVEKTLKFINTQDG